MSQEAILKVLKDNKNPISAKQLAEILKISVDSVRKSLRRLYKSKDIQKIILSKEEVTVNKVKYSGRHFLWTISNDA